MIKSSKDEQAKELWLQKSRDRLHRFILPQANIKGAYLRADLSVAEMKANHNLGPFETYFLGQAYVAALLMASGLKGNDRMNLKVSTQGPMGGFTVDATPTGEVRGYLFQNPIRIPQEWAEPTTQDIAGTGFLSVTFYKEGHRIPVTGSVDYQGAGLAEALAHYYDQSEQIPTALLLSVVINREGELLGAAGLFLQALPGHKEELWNEVVQRLYTIPSIGDIRPELQDVKSLTDFWFGDWGVELLDQYPVEFFCPCSKDKFSKFLVGLSAEDHKSMVEEGPFPLQTTCANCNSTYEFTQEELKELFHYKA